MITRTQVSLGTTWKTQGSRMRRAAAAVAAVAMTGALALGVFGATHQAPTHVSQVAGSTWSAQGVPLPQVMGSTWS
jgi:hypothetical protein